MMIARLFSTISILVFSLSSAINFIPPPQDAYDPWSEPYNLSQSGAAANPNMVIDLNGVVHVVWEDEFNGRMYSFLSEDVWSEPQIVVFPFVGVNLDFVSDDNGFIHAFWVNKQGALLYSRVLADRFGVAEAWVATQTLAGSAINYDVNIDSQGFLHLAYIRNIDADGVMPGIYYKSSQDSGINWSLPTPIYQTQYYRSLTEENTHVNLSSSLAAGFTRVFITWDIQPLRQVFYVHSFDGGINWESPVEIGKLYPDAKKKNFSNVRAITNRDNIILLWQEDFSSTSCSQRYAFTQDVGDTWSEPQFMLGTLRGCALDNQFVGEIDGYPVLQTTYQSQIYLSVWTGTSWSIPLAQHGILQFQDPQTDLINTLSGQELRLINQNTMMLVGVDTSEYSDVWVRTKEISGVQSWFPSEGSWNEPSIIFTREHTVNSPIMIGGLDRKLHQFWSETDNTQTSNTQEAIYYSEWDGEEWSTPNIIVRSPDGSTAQPRVIIDSSHRLLLVWGDPQNGSVYFSWANENLARGAAEWTEPVTIPSSYMVSGKYDIAVDASGMIYVVYAIRLNEGRGVYLTRSNDLGTTWSEPKQIFDGVVSGWEMLDDPNIIASKDGVLNVTWIRYSLPGIGGSLGVSSSYSRDKGETWSEAALISEDAIKWNDIVYGGSGLLFCIWQKEEPGFYSTMFSTSQDGGVTWDQPQSIGSTWDVQKVVSLSVDPVGNLHLLKQVPENPNVVIVRHWEWNGTEWLLDDQPITVSANDISDLRSLGVAISDVGSLGVVLSGSVVSNEASQELENLVFVYRQLPLPQSDNQQQTSQVETPQFTPTPTSEDTQAFQPTPTESPGQAIINKQPSNVTSSNTYIGVVFGLVITVALIAVALVWRFYRTRAVARK